MPRRRVAAAAALVGLGAIAIGSFICHRCIETDGLPEVSPSVAASDPSSASPAPPTPRKAPAESGPSTTIVVLKVAPAGVALVACADKPFPFESRPDAGCGDAQGARWQIEDPSGHLLAEGPLELPHLCRCPEGHDHYRGCVVVPHEAVVRVHLPRFARQETLKLFDAGTQLASFSLEDPS